jgi:hypothetical protein
MVSTDPDDLADDDIEALLPQASRDRDGVGSLHDLEEEAGDEAALHDAFDMDDREAKELGVQLDARDEPEPGFE